MKKLIGSLFLCLLISACGKNPVFSVIQEVSPSDNIADLNGTTKWAYSKAKAYAYVWNSNARTFNIKCDDILSNGTGNWQFTFIASNKATSLDLLVKTDGNMTVLYENPVDWYYYYYEYSYYAALESYSWSKNSKDWINDIAKLEPNFTTGKMKLENCYNEINYFVLTFTSDAVPSTYYKVQLLPNYYVYKQ